MIRNRNVLVTTTATLEGYEVSAYLGVISAHVVAGTGLFSDVFASFSDIFGGRSHSYQKQLAAINDEVVELLKEKAVARGANCIVGLRVDHDEIAGGGKSMFMVSAIGTAVTAEHVRQTSTADAEPVTTLSSDDLITLVRSKRLIDAARQGTLELDAETWEFLSVNRIHEVAPNILVTVKRARELLQTVPSDFFERSKAYFHSLPDDKVKQHLYPFFAQDEGPMHQYALELLAEMDLLDLGEASRMLQSENFKIRKRALSLLQLHKPVYSVSDIEELETLCRQVQITFQKRGRVVEVEQRFSKPKKKWECECGTKMPIDESFCTKCYRDICGFEPHETKPDHIVDLLTRRSAMLRHMLKSEALGTQPIS